jgi:HSP20 family molecular chaperone IbpA
MEARYENGVLEVKLRKVLGTKLRKVEVRIK